MIVSINQPAYFPWLGYFHRIAASDRHIILDHVQFEKNSFVNRNKIRTKDGSCWLTVPVMSKGKFKNLPINEVEINNVVDWRKKHWATIKQNYAKAPYFNEHAPFFESLYAKNHDLLAPLCVEITSYLLKAFGITTPMQLSSSMNVHSTKSDLVYELCKRVGAKTYLSGILGKDYLEEDAFTRDGIAVLYQNYNHPTYKQCQSGNFEPYMGAIDLLFNHGPQSLEILMKDNSSKGNISV